MEEITKLYVVENGDEKSTAQVIEEIASLPEDTVRMVAAFMKYNFGAVMTGQTDSDWINEAEWLFALIGLSEVKRGH